MVIPGLEQMNAEGNSLCRKWRGKEIVYLPHFPRRSAQKHHYTRPGGGGGGGGLPYEMDGDARRLA